jgi:hypothetical protein
MSARVVSGVLGAAAITLGACASAPEVALCVRTAPDDRPFEEDATELTLRATPLVGLAIQQSFQPEARTLRLPTLDYGTWSFTLEANYGPTLKATGQTPFFEITSADDRVPCLYFATVGTFGDTPAAPPVDAVHLVFSARGSSTALLATDGGLLLYDHETGSFAPELLPLPVSSAAGAVWTSLSGGRAAVITREGQGAIVGPNGIREGEVTALLDVGPLDGAAAVFVGVSSVLLIGGADDFATAPAAEGSLRIVDLANGTVSFLGTDPTGPLALRDTRVEPLGNATFLIAGGNEGSAEAPIASAIIAVIDPDPIGGGVGGVIGAATLDLPRRDAALAVTGGNVLVFGGRDASDVLLDSIERFQISGGQPVHLAAPSRPLTTARSGALALAAGGAVLVVGGKTGSADTDATADRFSFERDGAVAANAPGVALPSPAAALMHDGAILVVSPGAAVVYRP